MPVPNLGSNAAIAERLHNSTQAHLLGKNTPYAAMMKDAARMTAQLAKAGAEQARFAAAANDPKLLAAVARIAGITAAIEAQGRAVRQKIELSVREHAVTSGNYVKQLAFTQRLAREHKAVERLERRAVLNAQYGKVGGAVAAGAERMGLAGAAGRAGQVAHNVAQYASGKLHGAAMSGFGNTVELMAFQNEIQLINREIAGAFRPAMVGATRAFGTLRKRLESATTQQQNTLMTGGLALAGGLGAHVLSKTLFGAGLGTLAGRGVGALAGAGGAGAMLGAGGLGAAASAFGVRNEALGGAAAFGGIRGAVKGTGILKGAGRAVLPVAAGIAAYEGATGGFYEELRKRGKSKFTSALGAAGGGFMDLLSFGEYGRRFREKYPSATAQPPTPNKERDKALIADAGFDSPGSAFERMANAFAVRNAQDLNMKAGINDQGTLEKILMRIDTVLAYFIGPQVR